MGNNTSKQNGVFRADANGDKPAEEAVFKWSAGIAGKRYQNIHKGHAAGNAQSMAAIGRGSPDQARTASGARLGFGRLLSNRRGMRGDMLPAGLEAEKSPSVITLYSFDGISAADASETPSVSSLFADQRAHSDVVKASSPVVMRSIGAPGRSLACDASSEPLLATPNRTTTLTSLSVLALPSHGGVAPLDCMQRLRKIPTSMTDTTRGGASGANFLSDTTITKPRGGAAAATKDRQTAADVAAKAKNARDRHAPSCPPGDRCRDTALRTQMKTSEAGVMQQLRHEGIVTTSSVHNELTNKRHTESRSILTELRDMGLVSSSAGSRQPPQDPESAGTTPRAPARLVAIEQSRTAQLRDLDDAEDLLDTLDLELEKGDRDYLSNGRERLIRRRRLPICSSLVDTAEYGPEEEHCYPKPEARGDSGKPEQMTNIGKVMTNLDLL